MRHAPQPLLWSPPASAVAAMSQRHPSVSPQIDRSALKVASDPRKLLAPLPIPAATPAASSALQCAEKRRGGARLAMHDDGSAGCSSAGPVAPYSRVTCRRPDDSLAPPLMEGRSAPLPPPLHQRWRDGCRRGAGRCRAQRVPPDRPTRARRNLRRPRRAEHPRVASRRIGEQRKLLASPLGSAAAPAAFSDLKPTLSADRSI